MSGSPTDPIRAFIAARPGKAAQAELIRVQCELKKALAAFGLRIKWTDPETFHITILFLGDIPTTETDRVFQTLELAVSGHICFSSCLREVGVFKKSGALWVGIDTPSGLLRLQSELAAALDFEPGRFHAHFTLGRIKKGVPDQTFFQCLETRVVGPVSFDVKELELVRSELLADGARHTVLGTVPLGRHEI